jgi:hypothetical protein
MGIRILDKASGAYLGDITREDLQLMIDQFEEESSRDQDYFIDTQTIELLHGAGASDPLLKLLRDIVGTSDGVDIRWEES